MNAMPRSPDAGNGSAPTALLRTLLLADLAESTTLVEQLGDARTAVLLQRLDLQTRDLLGFTGGRLIDKADGLLAMFERPLQAVDFALRYQRLLQEVSQQEGMSLQARVGIHVGEVMTWENPPQAVAAGAKPLEVEGLAKPVAARLMALALPSQILLSGMAQTLAQRAQAELGERVHRLRWLVHGRYGFKGVPAPMLVHEVGEVGLAPLKAPPSSSKAWREVPFWRRPPVLAAEALLAFALIGGSLYSLLRSPPAIAFHERDWVVVGDMSNFTGDDRLQDSLDTALRVGLEQSRFVNVLPELKVRSALQRMGRDEQASVDRAVGSEIALREGARALLLPSVAEIGGRLRVNIELVDPATQVTVHAESAEGRGAESALASLDRVNAGLRERLGESLGDIEANTRPLAQVTTPDLEALRLFSLASEAARRSKFAEALRLLNLALARDPEFAMAYAARAQYHIRSNDHARARADFAAAQRRRARLSGREALQLDANAAFFGPPAAAIEQWRTYARAYPDAFEAHLQAAELELTFLQHYASAIRTLAPALTSRNPRQPSAWYMLGMSQLALEQYPRASAAFDKYEALGGRGYNRDHADLFAAQRRHADATRILRKQDRTGATGMDLDMRLPEVTYPLDQGRWQDAMAALATLQAAAGAGTGLQARAYRGTAVGLRAMGEGAAALPELQALLADETARAQSPDGGDRPHALLAALYAAGWVARLGDAPLAERHIEQLQGAATDIAYPAVADMLAIARAEVALAGKDAGQALAQLQPRVDGGELYLLHEVLLRAYRQQGHADAAMREAQWLAGRRGRAFVEWNSQFMLQPVNVLHSDLALLAAAELALAQGDLAAARSWRQRFRRAWPEAAGLPFVRPRLQALQRRLN